MFTLPKLDYSYDALEPYIDSKTMEVHHTKHHQTYIDKLNETLSDYPDFLDMDVDLLLSDLSKVPEVIRQKVINFGGGHSNHSFFWKIIGPKNNNTPVKEIELLKDEFINKASTLFGSGWTWIVKNEDKLEVINTPNQDSPLSLGKKPVLTIDLWEHAYYLKYMNKRIDYINNFWEIINWKKVEELL